MCRGGGREGGREERRKGEREEGRKGEGEREVARERERERDGGSLFLSQNICKEMR